MTDGLKTGLTYDEIREYLKKNPDLQGLLAASGKHERFGELVDYLYQLGVTAESRGRDLERLAYLDPLTGIHSRLFLNDRLRTVVGEAGRNAYKRTHEHGEIDPKEIYVGFLFADVDHFKQFNDQYGHLVGDNVLRDVGEAIRRSLSRTQDFPARYGGEEFAILLPKTGNDGALVIAERLQANIAQIKANDHKGNIIQNEGQHVGVTMSIGIFCLGVTNHYTDFTSENLIKGADEALYRAKNSGRNVICVNNGGQIFIHPEHRRTY